MGETYAEFLASKRLTAPVAGFNATELPPLLKDWQARIVHWACRLGKAAIFADTGLGKTGMQLAWAAQVSAFTGKPVLILAPLAVADQTRREGEKFGVPVTVCRENDDVRDGVNVTNYQRLHLFDVAEFGGVVLDESGILKSYMGKTKQQLIELFADTPYRLCCTATPAPNDHLELGNHSQFLGVMPSNEMISRWFINDASEAGNYRLKKHAEADYWRWVASWAVALSLPSDLNGSDEGYVLPPLNIHQHIVEVDRDPSEMGVLFTDATLSATSMHREMRRTASARALQVLELVSDHPSDGWVIWCNTDYEADELTTLLPDAIEVRGSDPVEQKERLLAEFSQGKHRVIITKPSIAGFGLNWQHVHRMAFVGLSYSYEALYQALRRSWRFGQTHAVDAHLICAETERGVLQTLKRKQTDHEEMKRQMVTAMRSVQLDESASRRLVQVPRDLAEGEGWSLHLGDSCEVIREIEDDSIGFSVFSPPFSNLYIYSDAEADMGNSSNDEEFFEHFRYLVGELYRVMIPGRIVSVHCKDLPLYKGRDGAAGLKDFPGAIIRLFEECGFTFHSRVTIWKCPVIEMTRTKNHGLLYKQLRKDSTASRQGMADYLVSFRKWLPGMDEFPDPVPHTHEQFPLDYWQRLASPVWMDINQMDVLNTKIAKDNSDEKHICPLQLSVIRRALFLWSNPGDLVLSPFAGIGSEGYVSLQEKRRFVGIELKPAYWKQAISYLTGAAVSAGQQAMSLFDEASE